MFTNTWNPFHHHTKFLLKILMRSQDEFCHESKTNPNGVVWNIGNVRKFCKNADRLLAHIFALMQIENGQLGRGTELSTIAWHNMASAPRNIYWF